MWAQQSAKGYHLESLTLPNEMGLLAVPSQLALAIVGVFDSSNYVRQPK